MDYKKSKLINIEYDFAIDNNYENFDYNSFGIDLSLNNFVTKFNFLEENNEMGSANFLENETKFNIYDQSRSENGFLKKRNYATNILI